MRKFILPLIIILILTAISVSMVFVSEQEIIQQLPFVSELYENCKINVTAVNGQARIKIDGEDYGDTNQEIENLPPGLHKVELSRITKNDNDAFYKKRVYPVELAMGTEAVIKIEIGPENLTSGYVLYYTEASTNEQEGLLTVTVDNYEGLIYLDDKYFGTSPVKTEKLEEATYSLRVSGEGYEDVEIPSIKVTEGYNLNIIVYLMPVPIQNL